MTAFDFGFVKTTSASGETGQTYSTTKVAVDADLFLVKVVPLSGKETTDYSATGPIKFIEGFFHKHVRLRCDGEPATVALANKVKHISGDLVKLETTPKHSSASNPAERAIQAVEERSRTIRADCQMRFGSSETFGAVKQIWAWLLRHAGWQISRYKPKGNGVAAYKQAYGEHYTHEVVPLTEIVLVGASWPVWVGRSDLSDEHIVLTPGGRVLSRTIRRLELSRRHDAGFLDMVKGLLWDVHDGIVRGRPRKEPAPLPPVLDGENTQSHNPDLPDKIEEMHTETPKETDDTNDTDRMPMSETPMDDGRDASNIKSKCSLDDATGVRQRLKFDGVATGMTPDPKRSKETVKQGEIRESNALPRKWCDSRRNLEMAARVQSRRKSWLRAAGLTSMARDRCSRDSIARWNQISIRQSLRLRWIACWKTELFVIFRETKVLACMKHLTTKWEKTWRKRNNKLECKVRFVEREYRWEEFREDLFAPGASYCTGRIVDILSLKRRVPTFLDCTDVFFSTKLLSPTTWWLRSLKSS